MSGNDDVNGARISRRFIPFRSLPSRRGAAYSTERLPYSEPEFRAVIAQKRVVSRLSAAALRERWRQMADDPLLRAIPYKVELNEKGSIEVSPATPRHALLQSLISAELHRLLPAGSTFVECPIETEIGVRVADVAWASRDFLVGRALDEPFGRAPELCVEVLSRLNTRAEIDEKVGAYLAAGAREVWLVGESGAIEIIGPEGARPLSELGITLTLPR